MQTLQYLSDIKKSNQIKPKSPAPLSPQSKSSANILGSNKKNDSTAEKNKREFIS